MDAERLALVRRLELWVSLNHLAKVDAVGVGVGPKEPTADNHTGSLNSINVKRKITFGQFFQEGGRGERCDGVAVAKEDANKGIYGWGRSTVCPDTKV